MNTTCQSHRVVSPGLARHPSPVGHQVGWASLRLEPRPASSELQLSKQLMIVTTVGGGPGSAMAQLGAVRVVLAQLMRGSNRSSGWWQAG